jgi:hypothetical protein
METFIQRHPLLAYYVSLALAAALWIVVLALRPGDDFAFQCRNLDVDRGDA